MTPILRLIEHGPAVRSELDGETFIALASQKALDVRREAGGAALVRAKHYVGALGPGGLQVHIEPKVGIRRLLFLLGYARDPDGWRDEEVQLPADTDLLPTMAHALATTCTRTLSQGLLQGYQTREERLPSLRGRLDEAGQMAAGRGLPLPVAVRYDDFTPDIAENQVVRTAIVRLRRVRGLSRRAAADLRRLDSALVGVSIIASGHRLRFRWDRRNRRYRGAVTLAQLVLTGGSVEQSGAEATHSAGAFLFDMNRVFEDFLSEALGSALAQRGGRVGRQVATHLDDEATVAIVPDLVWWSPAGPVVIDAKYKSDAEPNADLYQVTSYCTALGSCSGHLVDASAGQLAGSRHRIRRSPIGLHRWHLDLSREPAALMAQVDELAAAIASTSVAR